MDQIKIEELKVFAHHGVFPEETENGQNFYVNAVMGTETREAGKTDQLEFSTHYGEVCLTIHEYLTANTFKLLETAAEGLAEKLLLTYPKIRTVRLEIRKPQAPIPLPFDSVSVQIERGWNKAYIAFGSNLGDREDLIMKAIDQLKKNSNIRVKKVSSIIRTKPYGNAAKEEFLNGVLEAETLFEPEELLDVLQRLEQEAGRVREIRWGDRTLDLDILLYEDRIVGTERLMIPHADMENRDFVLTPLAEIAPYAIHPISGKSALMMSRELERSAADRHFIL